MQEEETPGMEVWTGTLPQGTKGRSHRQQQNYDVQKGKKKLRKPIEKKSQKLRTLSVAPLAPNPPLSTNTFF